MKRYLTYVTAFACIIALLLVAGEAVVRQYPNSYRYKAEWMNNNAASVKTLVLGGSHTYYGIMPSLLGDSVFSLANVTQHPEYDYWLLNHYIEKCTNLRTIIVPVDETNLFDPPLADSDEWFRCAYYNIYMECDMHKSNPIYNYEIANLPTFNRKFMASVKRMLKGTVVFDCDSTGFGSGFTPETSKKQKELLYNAINTAQRHQGIDSASVVYNELYLSKVADLCRKHNVTMVMVTPPMWHGYVKLVDKKRFEVLSTIVTRYQKEYGAMYRNYMNDTRFQEFDFHDCDHLATPGAKKFSAIIKNDFPQL